jgi:hypothetical protein
MSVVGLPEYLYPKYCRILGEINVTGIVQTHHFTFHIYILKIARYDPSGKLRNCWSIRVTIVAVEKLISITYFECVSAALMSHHSKSKRRMILSAVACLPVPYFPHYPINGTIFGEKLRKEKRFSLFRRAF